MSVGSLAAQTLEPAVWPQPRPLNEDRLAELGLRVVRGEHVTLVTDLAPSAEIDRLPSIASLALPELIDYFPAERDAVSDWHVQAYLIGEREKFAAAGLLPPTGHGEFLHGLSMGYELWLNEQPTDYYRRALFLHELAHSFMATLLGSCGPSWYMEAVAELQGAHEYDARANKLRLGVMPASRDVAPSWGRVPLVRAATDANGNPAPLAINAIMQIDNRRVLGVESYAWVWALAKFLDTHPRYQDRFRKLPEIVLRQDFNQRFRDAYREDWRELSVEFRLFAATLEYGHDLAREAIDFSDGDPLDAGTVRQATVQANRGWQAAGVAVRQGVAYRYKCDGEFVIAREPDDTPWPCQAGGVTIEYHGGRPLGQLLAAVDAEDGFLRPLALGVRGEFTAPATGTLYLRVNDSPAQLADNEGTLRFAVRRVASD
ncbi:MAG: hypothetical protein AAGF31_02395 [Planctomycetota bacterium]